MTGRRSRDRSAYTERAVVRLPQAQGHATQGSLAWCAGSESSVPTPGADCAVEVEGRGSGFCQPHHWLDQRAVLIAKEDQHLVVLRMLQAEEIAKRAA